MALAWLVAGAGGGVERAAGGATVWPRMVVFTGVGEVAGVDRRAEAEFGEFMHSRWLQLLRLGFVLTGDQGLAEDLAQTALARAYASWPQIRRAGDPDAYVRRVMVNANHSRFRKRRVAEQLTAAVPEPALVDVTGGCDDRVTLMAALMSLPLGQRSVVVLRFWLDMTETQVAEVLGCSVGNVKSQATRALAKLRASSALGEGVSRELL
jgi:RNA polymerase sigma-70 factor (sigma-E family)